MTWPSGHVDADRCGHEYDLRRLRQSPRASLCFPQKMMVLLKDTELGVLFCYSLEALRKLKMEFEASFGSVAVGVLSIHGGGLIVR